ncbi:hypothetical protein DFH09DRAFT_1137988 [Mycena vulgaris]|nr:hypothetical protein DFH09DRAFT_1137988 [Mycena vulgaris]
MPHFRLPRVLQTPPVSTTTRTHIPHRDRVPRRELHLPAVPYLPRQPGALLGRPPPPAPAPDHCQLYRVRQSPPIRRPPAAALVRRDHLRRRRLARLVGQRRRAGERQQRPVRSLLPPATRPRPPRPEACPRHCMILVPFQSVPIDVVSRSLSSSDWILTNAHQKATTTPYPRLLICPAGLSFPSSASCFFCISTTTTTRSGAFPNPPHSHSHLVLHTLRRLAL